MIQQNNIKPIVFMRSFIRRWTVHSSLFFRILFLLTRSYALGLVGCTTLCHHLDSLRRIPRFVTGGRQHGSLSALLMNYYFFFSINAHSDVPCNEYEMRPVQSEIYACRNNLLTVWSAGYRAVKKFLISHRVPN